MATDLVKQTNQVAQFDFFNQSQFEVMQRICKMFANSELVPDMYKASQNNPLEKAMANCMIAVEMAQRVGASPLMIMQNMVIIYGRPSWSSKFLVSTVNTCGRYETLKYRITKLGKLGKVEYTVFEKKWSNGTNGQKGHYETIEKKEVFDGSEIDNIECVAYTTEKGSKEVLESTPITIKMAVEEGWFNKKGSKWSTMPEQMLRYRAASFWTNAYAPELSMGMRTEDEVRDIIDLDPKEYEDITHKVEKEIQNNANKESLKIEDENKSGEASGNMQQDLAQEKQSETKPEEKKQAQQKLTPDF